MRAARSESMTENEASSNAVDDSHSSAAPSSFISCSQSHSPFVCDRYLDLNCETSCVVPVKYAPFYGDVYGHALFGPVMDFGLYHHGMPFDDAHGVSILSPPLYHGHGAFYRPVPTEETSLEGRERRRKQTQKRKTPTEGQHFHYLSAVCGASFPGDDLSPFSSGKIPAVHLAPVANAENQPYDEGAEMATFLQQLLAEMPPAPDCNIDDSASSLLEKKHQEPLFESFRGSARCKRGRRSFGEGRERTSTHSDDVTQCVAMLGPKGKRKRTLKESAAGKRTSGSAVQEGRSSRFRGVTKHRRSGRWEAHIWIKEMGRQVYLGGYEKEEHAAEAYDVAAIKSKGDKVKTNFDLAKYQDLRAVMDSITMDELVMIVRRQSQGFSRGTSVFRGVTHHPSGRWEARIGIPGSKHIYLGLYNDEFEAAKWYDRALVRLRGPAAATNFLLSNYQEELAEYNQLHEAIRRGEDTQEGVTKLGVSFEHWVKFGCKGEAAAAQSDLLATDAAEGDREKKHLVSQLVTHALTHRSNLSSLNIDQEFSQDVFAAEAKPCTDQT